MLHSDGEDLRLVELEKWVQALKTRKFHKTNNVKIWRKHSLLEDLDPLGWVAYQEKNHHNRYCNNHNNKNAKRENGSSSTNTKINHP